MSHEEEKTLKSLKPFLIKRSSIKGQVTKFKNYIEKISSQTEISSIEIAELSLKLSRFELLSTRFDDLQSEIEVLNSQNIDLELDERERIEHEFIQSIALAKGMIHSYEGQNSMIEEKRRASMPNACCSQDTRFKLPQIQVSAFDGSYFRWLEFRDTYVSLVHKNERIPDIHKFHYLLSYLQGDAARVISNLEVSSANYAEAWNLICKRFDNKRILINHHLDSLFNVQNITKESEKTLRYLVDHVTKNLRALNSLGQPTEYWDLLIIFLMSSKLDSRTSIKWEEHRTTLGDTPTLAQFCKFLTDRADVLESLNKTKTPNTSFQRLPFVPRPSQFVGQHTSVKNKSFNKNETLQKTFVGSSQTQQKPNNFICIVCDGNHRIYDCTTFKQKNIKERLSIVSKYKLCKNCLKQGHPFEECRLGPCRQCSGRHNTLLHDSNPTIGSHPAEIQNEAVVAVSRETSNTVLLSTAMIEVCNPKTKEVATVRALLDSGSQCTFIKESLKKRLNISCNNVDSLRVIGIGNNCVNQVSNCCTIKLNSLLETYNVTLTCYVLDELTGNLPKAPIDVRGLSLPKNLKLADPNFNHPAPVEILIGADLFWDIIKNEQHDLGPNHPKLQNTKLGWIIAGPFSSKVHNQNSGQPLQCNLTMFDDKPQINELIKKFWELEEIPTKALLTPSENECESHFLKTTIRLSSGRFCVRLPLKETPDCLGNSYHTAKKRFLGLERRFRKNPDLKKQYSEFIHEYQNLGHLTVSPVAIPNISYFLPHHAVFKESESTKIRVVFDGSAPTTSGYSLNDILMVGPNMQSSLFSILIRARLYKFILAGDINKFYRQVAVDQRDRDLQLILWRDDELQPIKTLQLGTVTYGTASASYLSTRCLFQVGEECKDKLISDIIQNDIYCDDLISGANDETELKYIQKSVSEALGSACFHLRKYKTNYAPLFNDQEFNSTEQLTISESSSTLGIGWDPTSDKFNFPVTINDNNKLVTKRNIMSSCFKIFDPLGLLSPSIIQPKILIQKLWLKDYDWDQPVSDDIKQEWHEIQNNFPSLKDLQVPRRVICDSPLAVELHSFSDASEKAYGACIYMRSFNEKHEVTVRLLCSKSKVAPLKQTTIPRLELCAALLAAKLSNSVLTSLRSSPCRVYHWCDSSIVLCWLNKDPKTLKTFVANRVGELLELTDPNSWRYVPTNLNPADLISRGINGRLLCSNVMWWSGPSFLKEDETKWPKLNKTKLTKNDLPELKVVTVALEEPKYDFKRFSKFTKLQRTFAYVLRFLHNAKSSNRQSRLSGLLTAKELTQSFYFICKIAQKQSFQTEYEILLNNKELHHKSKILSLSPFFEHESNLIRVGGRLDSSTCPYDKRHPILLDSSHRVVRLYLEREHVLNLHAGPQLLLASVRNIIWPLNGRKLARRIVKECTTCNRFRAKALYPKMGQLPRSRVSVDFPFRSVGIDYAGPFLILNRKGRGAKTSKCYLCLFICLRFKCVHLEAVTDLTKDAFIMTMRRFIARRGRPTEVWSDNGRNFVAASKEISYFLKQNNEPLSEFGSQEGIDFKFIPAYAPHFGGLWEAGIKSAKYHIKRVMGNSHLTLEELSTLFAQVEAVLNSRPLCPMSSSPDDFLALTPGHFLIGRPLNSLPSKNLTEHTESSLNRYARLEQMHQHFWKRWQAEYLAELQNRAKWRTDNTTLNTGDLVLLQEDNVSPLNWRLGRVTKLFPGKDGIHRVAEIKTQRGTARRPLVRLCPLPSPSQLQS